MSEKMDFSENLFPFDQLEGATGFLIWRVSNMWQREVKNILAEEEDLTHTQFMLLGGIYWLCHKEESVSQKKLSEIARTDKMTVSAVLRTLEKKGIVRREIDSGDSRAKSILLTEEGLLIFRKAVTKIRDAAHSLFLAGPEEDRQIMNRYLADILTREGDKF